MRLLILDFQKIGSSHHHEGIIYFSEANLILGTFLECATKLGPKNQVCFAKNSLKYCATLQCVLENWQTNIKKGKSLQTRSPGFFYFLVCCHLFGHLYRAVTKSMDLKYHKRLTESGFLTQSPTNHIVFKYAHWHIHWFLIASTRKESQGGGKWENKKPGWLHFDTSPLKNHAASRRGSTPNLYSSLIWCRYCINVLFRGKINNKIFYILVKKLISTDLYW